MQRFEYDYDASDEQNFIAWSLMNADERDGVGQAPLPQEEARGLFNELKESGWLMRSREEADQGKSESNW